MRGQLLRQVHKKKEGAPGGCWNELGNEAQGTNAGEG
jgi:hypothetical protein